MAVLAIVSCITVRRVAPLVGSLHRGTGGAAVLVLPWTPPPVLVVVELRAGVALPAQPRRLLARLRTVGSQYWAVWRGWPAAYLGFVVCQNVGHMASSQTTANGSIKAEYEEEFLISSSNTVTKEETMMV